MPEKLSLKPLPDRAICRMVDGKVSVIATGKGLMLESGELIPNGVQAGDAVEMINHSALRYITLDGEDLIVLPAAHLRKIEEDA